MARDKLLTFRQWLRKDGDKTEFRRDYLADRRQPNATRWEELAAYLKGCPFPQATHDAKAAWKAYEAIPEVKKENRDYWMHLLSRA